MLTAGFEPAIPVGEGPLELAPYVITVIGSRLVGHEEKNNLILEGKYSGKMPVTKPWRT
jgi:hypothetical protein